MNLVVRCHYAVVAFNSDLTDPKAGSVPIAVVGSGEPSPASSAAAGVGQFTFVLAHKAPAGVKDPVVRQLWDDIPRRLREDVQLGVRTVGAGRLLGWLSGRLAGQSAQVVHTGDKEIKATDPGGVLGEIARGLEGVFVSNSPRPRRSEAVAQTSAFSFEAVPELVKGHQ